jgi:AcrR family transcriptional regulator
MTSGTSPEPPRRSGAETRAIAQRTALRLFTEQGYDATSLRQIADELGINKASLYYYFDSKQAILESVFDKRGDETQQLLAWLAEQPRTPGLLEAAVMRWVESFSIEKLEGIRFMAANPHLGRPSAAGAGSARIGAGLSGLADELAKLLPDPSPEKELVMRMALLSINSAVHAASSSGYSDEEVVSAAVRAARALLAVVVDGTETPTL